MHYDGKEHMFPFSTLRDWCGCAALTYIGSNKIEFEALLLYTKTAIHRSGIYREIDLPAATTGGYLFVRIACRV